MYSSDNTSGNTIIKKAMDLRDITFKEEYETLIKQGYVDTQVNMETSFYEESNTKSSWGLFMYAGYLTIDKIIMMPNFYRN